jgi:hypothetical protein
MSLIEKLKNFWDTRTDKEKAYDEWNRATPMQKRSQKMLVYVRDLEEPFTVTYTLKDWYLYGDKMRRASDKKTFNRYLSDWIEERGAKGIRDGSVWYSPESILRIELGEQTVEPL